jgi:hypothetical protein
MTRRLPASNPSLRSASLKIRFTVLVRLTRVKFIGAGVREDLEGRLETVQLKSTVIGDSTERWGPRIPRGRKCQQH